MFLVFCVPCFACKTIANCCRWVGASTAAMTATIVCFVGLWFLVYSQLFSSWKRHQNQFFFWSHAKFSLHNRSEWFDWSKTMTSHEIDGTCVSYLLYAIERQTNCMPITAHSPLKWIEKCKKRVQKKWINRKKIQKNKRFFLFYSPIFFRFSSAQIFDLVFFWFCFVRWLQCSR